jgi:hypothetical protein
VRGHEPIYRLKIEEPSSSSRGTQRCGEVVSSLEGLVFKRRWPHRKLRLDQLPAARNWATTESGRRPRSFTLMPLARAQARTDAGAGLILTGRALVLRERFTRRPAAVKGARSERSLCAPLTSRSISHWLPSRLKCSLSPWLGESSLPVKSSIRTMTFLCTTMLLICDSQDPSRDGTSKDVRQ